MREVLLSTPTTVSVVLLATSDGNPLTGVTDVAVTLYLRKAGGEPEEKTIGSNNFREVDATNLPGVYEIDFDATDLDTRGELVFVIAENGPADLQQYSETIRVGDLASGAREAYSLTVASGESKTFALGLERDGVPYEGVVPAEASSDVFVNGVAQDNTVYTSLTELSRGVYSITVPNTFTDAEGDLLVRVRPLSAIEEGASEDTVLSNLNHEDIFVAPLARNEAFVAIVDSFTNDSIFVSNDRGQTFEELEFRPGGGFTAGPRGIAGDPNDPDSFVIATRIGAASEVRAYYTDDGGATFTDADEISPTTVTDVSRIATEPPGHTSFYILGRNGSNSFVFSGSTFASTLTLANTFPAGVFMNDVERQGSFRALTVGEDSGVSSIYRFAGSWATATTVPNVGVLNGVSVLPSGVGWAVGDAGGLLYTTDDGDTWTDQSANIGTANDLTDVVTVDDNTAYVVGSSGDFFFTEDAGATWSTPGVVTTFGSTSNFLQAVRSDSGVFVVDGDGLFIYEEGKPSPNPFDATLARLEVTPAIPEVTPEDEIKTILNAELPRLKSQVNIPVDTAQTFAAYLSQDGAPNTGISGAAVTSLLFKQGVETANTINTTITELDDSTLPGWYTFDLSVSDTDTLGDLVVDFRGEGASTTTSNQTFPATSATSGGGVYAKSATEAYIGGDGSNPVQTVDGGATWTEDTAIGFGSYFRPDGVPGTDFVAVGGFDSGTAFFYTDDFGTSWNSAFENTFTVFNDITDVTAVTVDEVYMVAGGYIMEWDRNVASGDLPLLYEPGDVGSGSESLSGIDAPSLAVIVAVGDDSGAFILRSDDNGVTWFSIPATGASGALNDIDFVGPSGGVTCWAVGDSGTILKSTDAGATFSAQTSGTAANLEAVYASSELVAWAVGAEVVLLTVDGGATWTEPAEINAFMTSRTAKGVGGIGSEIWIAGQDDSGAAEPFILNVDFANVSLNPTTFRFFVQGEGSVDLTPVTDALTDIQGAGFATGTDSLVQIRTNVDAVDTVANTIDGKVDAVDTLATAIDGKVDDVQGTGFDTSTDSLVQIRTTGATADVSPVLTAISNVDADVTSLTADVASIEASVTRLLGLSQENYRIIDQVYDANNKLTSATIRLFGSKADTDGNTNPIATYAITATYDTQGLLVDYKVTRES